MMMRIRRVITSNPQTMRTQLVQMLNTGDLPIVNPVPYNLEDSDDEDILNEDLDEEEEVDDDEEEEVDDDEEVDGDDEEEEEVDDDDEEEEVDEEIEIEDEVDEEEIEYPSIPDIIVNNINDSNGNNGTVQESNHDDNHISMDIEQTYDTFDIKIEGWFIV